MDERRDGRGGMTTHRWLQAILAIWALAFPVVACGPLLISEGAGGLTLGAIFGAAIVWLFLVPWLIGLVILGIGVYLTRPGRSR